MIDNHDIPDFKQGQSWNDVSARGMNALARAARRGGNIHGGRGVHVDSRIGGTLINVEPTPNDLHKRTWHVILVETPVEGDKTLTVRRLGYAELPPAYNELAWTTERFTAYPAFNRRAVDYAAFTFKDVDEGGQPREPSRNAIPLLAYKQRGGLWVVEAPTSGLQQFRVRAFGGDGDTLLCRTWDGADEGTEDVKVLLPHELRKSRYDAKSEELFDASSGQYVTVEYVAGPTLLTRTATIRSQSYSEQQIITPQYVESAHGGTIGPTIVVAVSAGSVAGGLGQPPDTPEEDRIGWMAQDARAWAEVFTQQTGAGIVQRMIERRGEGQRA